MKLDWLLLKVFHSWEGGETVLGALPFHPKCQLAAVLASRQIRKGQELQLACCKALLGKQVGGEAVIQALCKACVVLIEKLKQLQLSTGQLLAFCQHAVLPTTERSSLL